MPRKMREIRADLRKAGFQLIRQKGSHEPWKYPLLSELPITIAGKNGADAKRYVEELLEKALNALQEREKDNDST